MHPSASPAWTTAEGGYEWPRQIRALSCSEPYCGSISLRVKARVLTTAHGVPHDLPCPLSALAPSTLPVNRSSSNGLFPIFSEFQDYSLLFPMPETRSPISYLLQFRTQWPPTQEPLPDHYLLKIANSHPATVSLFPALLFFTVLITLWCLCMMYFMYVSSFMVCLTTLRH